ncbi:MAG: tail fiber domain-containing protein [Bdellovibrionota bacterium]
MQLRRAQGFSLIEMMMVLGVGGIVTLGIVSMMRNTAKQATSLERKNDFVQFANEFGAVFNNADHCRAAFASPNSSVPSLSTLGDIGDPANVPVPFALNLGNPAPGATSGVAVYKAGSKWGNSLTIIKLEFTGKTRINTIDPLHQRPQWTMPMHLVVSRRSGLKLATGTATSTATSTATAVGALPPGFTNSAGSEVSSGGDLLEKTFNLTVTLDGASSKIVGCFGQYQDFWTSAGISTKTSTSTSATTMTSLDIVYKGGNVVVWPDNTYTSDPSIATDTNISTSVKTAGAVAVGGTAQAQGYIYRSDERLKTNVRDIPDAAAKISALHGVEFDWKNNPSTAGKDQLGFLAQEVEKIFPEAVTVDSGTGLKEVAYESLISPLIEALKARQKVILRQQQDIDEIRKAIRNKQ